MDLKPTNGIYKGPEYIGSGSQYFRMGDLFHHDRVRSGNSEFQRIELTSTQLDKQRLAVGDLLFCRTSVAAAGIGKCSVVVQADEDIVPASNLIRIRLNLEIADPIFFFYFFSSQVGGEILRSMTRGAAVFTITGGDISGAEIPTFSLFEQRTISTVLNTYDELIENNSRRIEILEEMAQAIYREWFVEFRYPGHEDVPLVDSELGPIPEGWEVRSLPEVAEVAYGKNLPTKELNPDGRYPVYGAAKVIGRHSEKNVDERTIIMGCRGSCGAVTVTESEAFVTNNSFTLKTRGEIRQYLYWLLRLRGVSEFITGTAQPQITLTNLNQLRLLHPPVNLLDQFCSVAELNSDLIFSLYQTIDVLQETRDLLLPRLISGEIDVSELDIELADSSL